MVFDMSKTMKYAADRKFRRSRASPAKAPAGESPAQMAASPNARPGPPAVWQELLFLLLKIAAIALAFLLIFTFVFGILRNTDPDMSPAVADGDLVIFYRLDKRYAAQDVLVLDYQGQRQVRRVVAAAGDTEDITEDGLVVNGAIQQERDIYFPTQPYEDGIRFPITLKEGQVFVLGDHRTNATDSRIYGAVEVKDTLGKVMTLLRRRGL